MTRAIKRLKVYAVVATTTFMALTLLLVVTSTLGGIDPVLSVGLQVASPPELPVASPGALVGVDTGTNQAYVRVISADVQQGVLQGATATIYFPARGLKVFLVEVYAFDSGGNMLDYNATVGVTTGDTYTVAVGLTGGVQVIEVAQLEVRVTCLLGC